MPLALSERSDGLPGVLTQTGWRIPAWRNHDRIAGWVSEHLKMGARSAASRKGTRAALRARRERIAKAAKQAITKRPRING